MASLLPFFCCLHTVCCDYCKQTYHDNNNIIITIINIDVIEHLYKVQNFNQYKLIISD